MRALILIISILIVSCNTNEYNEERSCKSFTGDLVTHKVTGDTVIVVMQNGNLIQYRDNKYKIIKGRSWEVDPITYPDECQKYFE